MQMQGRGFLFLTRLLRMNEVHSHAIAALYVLNDVMNHVN